MTDERLDPARFPIKSVLGVVKARQRGMAMALAMGFSQVDATQIATVISELARNIIIHAGGEGTITLLACTDNTHVGEKKRGVKVIAQDRGPGIEDVELALTVGFSTARGLGLGLSGSRKLMDEFAIRSVVGAGTMVTVVKWLP
jgi:serine/threonine-protein kinase RsbT